jgi:predicted transcriptional regulator
MLEITQYINNDFKPFDVNENIAFVQGFFSDLTYSHFPILSDGIYIGCISSDDVVTFNPIHDLAEYRYTFEGFFVRPQMIWLDVLEVFAQNNTNLVPVLDENNQYLGFYELNDIIQFFHETPFMREEGGIITVQKPTKDYSMSQIAQIVETNNGKILGMFVNNANADFIQVTIKTTLGGLNEILQTFRRFDYEIISEHQEDSYLSNLKDRSDYLDRYLNI